MKTYTWQNFKASFRASLKKEWLEALSNHRLLIIGICFVGFAILDPLMTKLMPLILENQLAGIDLSALIKTTQKAAVGMYIGDLQELVQVVFVLLMMGSISQERSEKRLVIPLSMGLDLRAAYAAKWLLYGLILAFIIPFSMSVAFVYSGILFGFEGDLLPSITTASAFTTIYFVALLSFTLAMSEGFERPLTAGISTLFAVYGTSVIMGLWSSTKPWLPAQLIDFAKALDLESPIPTEALLSAMMITALSLGSLLIRKDYVTKSIR